MEFQKHETKPEGFHTEFKLNVKYVSCIIVSTMIITAIIIKYFIS